MNKKKPFYEISLGKLSIMAALSLLLLIGISLNGYFKIQESEESNRWVQHTLEVMATLEELRTHVYELGNAQRGYVLTSKTVYIDSYKEASLKIEESIKKNRSHVSDNTQQVENLRKIEELIYKLKKYYQKTITLVESGKVNDAITIVSGGKGQLILDQVNKNFQEMQNIEKDLLKIRLSDDREASQNASFIVLVGSLSAIAIVIWFIFFSYRQFKRKEQIQQELNQNLQIQKAILSSAAFALIATDKDGKITLFNPAAEKLLGYQDQEIMGRDLLIFYQPEEVAKLAHQLGKRYQERIPLGFDVLKYKANQGIIESDQWTYVRQDDSTVPVKMTLSPLADQQGEITGYIGIAYDISQQLDFEETLIHAREEALAGTKAKSEFLANMSHEIRTPMNAIIGMAELFKETELTEEQQKYVSIFQNAGSSLLVIINDILDLSKIEAGHFELDNHQFKLSSIVENAIEVMGVKAHQKHLEMIIDMEDDLHDCYIGDGNRLRQIFLNLLGNAIKFTKRGEVILTISRGAILEDKQRELIIEVLDTGIGMTEAEVSRLFQRFAQADSSITKEFGGTGLGLNITKKLIELMNGTIEVQSTKGIGTRFKVTIVLEEDPSTEDETSTHDFKNKKFLIVDDTKTNRFILKRVLEKLGAITEEAEDGITALEMIKNNIEVQGSPYDMILLDCRMPDMDGFTVAEKIIDQGNANNPMMMMLTSDNRPGDLARSKEIGIDAYLVKPFLKNELLQSIDKALKGISNPTPKIEEIAVKETPVLGKQQRILLVDDNDENRLIIIAFLKGQNFLIHEARDGKEAVGLYQKNDYDLILMDMQMPVMDGYSATREIRAMELESGNEFVPILAVSAFALKEEIERSIESGCNGHLTKPILKNTLLAKVTECTTPIEVVISKEMDDLVPDYIKSRKIEVIKLTEALSQNNFQLIQTTGHKLSGSAGSYGFQRLSEIGRDLEESAKASDYPSASLALSEYKLYMRLLTISYA